MSDRRARLVELKREIEWRKCATDERYFFETYWFIQHPARGKILFELRDAQVEALVHWAENRYSLTLKARQIGWSTLVAAHCFWRAFFHDDLNILMLSRTERESVKLLRKSKYGAKHLPDWMKSRGPRNLVDHSQKMIFDNGSQIESLPSASDPARGESASDVVVDEWAFLPNPEEAWASIEPVADVGGRIIGLSTANGSGGFFHQLWVGAETGNNNFKTMFYPWSAVDDRDSSWYESKKRAMPGWQLAQEYPTTAEEAFIKSGRPVFDVDQLATIEAADGFNGHLVQVTGPRDFRFELNLTPEEDVLTVWHDPIPGHAYSMGVDIAEGLDWGDYSSVHVCDSYDGSVVATWHGHIAPDVLADEVAMLGIWYNTALAVVEANNHGLTTITALRRLGYPRIYKRRRLNASGKTVGTEFGWNTNQASKPLMIDELAAALRDGELLLQCYSTIAELRTFVRDEKGRMHGSPHDDRVMSLALSNQGLHHVHSHEYEQVEDDYGTFQWWMRGGYETPQQSDGWVIGAHSGRR